ncbi:hypothetical protein A9Q98_06320 [Thalassotalea sp. 42_200_T64]|nr:hypothetical protein A9Q98_06320 [Thalassotalea sp. 42_200_T64]
MDNLLVEIKHRYKSSTRIDSNLTDSKVFIDNFILHGTAINVLETISRDYEGSEQRAFSITGPYGSGKSTIALFMSLLLSENKADREYAEDKLDCAEGIKSEFPNRFKIKKGWKTIKHVCSMASPEHAILKSLYSGLNITFKNDEINSLSDDECLSKIKATLTSKQVKSDGVLLLLDEMGKALDYCSKENKDLYLFQELADIAQQADVPVLLIGFLHQPFTEYAKNKDSKLQQDWAKVQGRYRDLSFNPSVDESLVLVGDAIHKSSEKVDTKLRKLHASIVNEVNDNFESKTRSTSDLFKTLPIDPMVSLLLGPISRRRFSQNERSLFGFLASHEASGFREFIEENYSKESKLDRLYHPENLWDYLHHNLYHIIVTSNDSKAWLESCDAIYRASTKGSELHTLITKLVALLTIFGFTQHFHASRTFIEAYFQCRGYKLKQIKSAISDLETWTVVIYRAAHDGLFIFQGSDIDINNLVNSQKEKIRQGIDWVKACQSSHPILATSHYHKTGTIRWASRALVSTVDDNLINNLKQEQEAGSAFISFIIPANEDAFAKLKKQESELVNMVLGQPGSLAQLSEAAIELIALEKIQKEERDIVHDKIAQQELDSRINMFKQQVANEQDRVFNTATWCYQAEGLAKQPLSSMASLIAKDAYNKAPVIINELVNRAKPSGSANAAIRKLLIAMAENWNSENLDLPESSFPAEKGLYFSCISNKGLHVKSSDGSFKFIMPSDDNDALQALFNSAFEYISNQGDIVRLSEITDIWSKKPFGLSKGIIPIWLMAFLLSQTSTFAFYDFDENSDKPMFINGPDEEFALKSLQRPDKVGIQYVKVDLATTTYLNEIAHPIKDELQEISPLTIAQVYVTRYSELSAWTKNTKKLTKTALAFKDKTRTASDPNEYLFKSFPTVFKTATDNITKENISNVLEQLDGAHDEMLNAFRARITSFIPLTGKLVAQCKKVAKFTADHKLKTFAIRLSEYGSNEHWVSSLISLLSGIAERNWDDNAIAKANAELVQIIERFKVASYFADFGDIDYPKIKNNYKKELGNISSSLNKLKRDEQRAILMTVLDQMLVE